MVVFQVVDEFAGLVIAVQGGAGEMVFECKSVAVGADEFAVYIAVVSLAAS